MEAFLRWHEQEVEPEGWHNPHTIVYPPKVPLDPLQPVELATVRRMAAVCPDMRSVTDLRDRSVILALLDTGCRASELVATALPDPDE